MKSLVCSLIILLFFTYRVHASHLRAGEIIVERISCSSLTYRITVRLFLDTESGVVVGGNDDWLDFGDGDSLLIEPQRTIRRPDLGENMGMVEFSVVHVYAGQDDYIISYSEPFRNEHIVNMDQSQNTRFYIESAVFLDGTMPCDENLPLLSVPPIDRACTGVSFSHNPGAYDPDPEDSLSFEIIVPQQAIRTEVFNYRDPNEREFYLNYDEGNEEKNGQPTFSIHPETGMLVWNAPGAAGEYNVAFRVISWRRNKLGVWTMVSYVVRDMQVIVEDCDNKRPDLIIPDDTCVVAGTRLDVPIFGTDPENHPVKIEIFSQLLVLPHPPVYTPNPPVFQPSDPHAQLRFTWNTQCDHIRELYHLVVFKITDNPPRGPKLTTFKTWRIKVVGPPPVWSSAVPDPVKKNVQLEWSPYQCDNASAMQVWRKIEGAQYTPGTCDTGMPGFLKYDLIATVPLKDPGSGQTVYRYLDTNNGNGLAPGARYCYRLVAVYPNSEGGESLVSQDICVIPVPAEAPVITHVTVEHTDPADGAIRVSWRSPFDLDRAQYPGPYEYDVYRSNVTDAPSWIRVTPPSRIQDTTFLDTGIDTGSGSYQYTVVLYSNTVSDPSTWAAIDTSANASSIRLETSPSANAIGLTWSATVPWSNESSLYPYHLVYRGEEGTPEEDLVLIDSVDVTQQGFAYTDRGAFNNIPLDPKKMYCYKIMTRGVYGNPRIEEPLENFSQMICSRTGDETAPCKPSLQLSSADCNTIFETMGCSVSTFKNILSWNRLPLSCGDDIAGYKVYSSAGPDRDFVLLAQNVRDTFYIDNNLPSFARCYRIAAIDYSGNESEWSDVVCNDNCPYFELPNVFTPNGDGCNELFSAFGPFNPLGYVNSECPENNQYSKCIRFVERVDFRVFNRWGMNVYSYRSGSERSVYINWNGKDNTGAQLSTGVYYYQAEVTFDTIDPEKKKQSFKGWVHLIR